MPSKARKAVLLTAAVLLSGTVARAQPEDPVGDLLSAALRNQAAQAAPPAPANARRPLSANDQALLRTAIDSARRADVAGARVALAAIQDPVAKKTALWVLVDSCAESLGFFELDTARRQLADWPRASKRQAAAERMLETSGKSPREIVDWFAGQAPTTARGAMALAAAWQDLGQDRKAAELIRRWWRDKSFEADAQQSMLARFAGMLTSDDYVRRADILLYGPQGPATQAMVAMLPPDQQAAAQARMALRADAADANDQVAALPASVANTPGVAFERAAYLRRHNLDNLALQLVPSFPKTVVTDEQADRIWDERYRLVLSALKTGDDEGAYAAAADSGLTEGADAAEAEFYAGWIALTRLKDPVRAGLHFAALERIGSSPITEGRALYWLGRAAEARGERTKAEDFYARAALYYTTFYGQLAAEKLGRPLVLGSDPTITPADRARFEAREPVQATRLLFESGQKDLFRAMVLGLDDILPSPEDEALLIDLARGYGEQDMSMRVARVAAQRGFILPQRGYPYRTPPRAPGAPEPALVLGITRQESGFDPLVRSGAGARGMMQLLPSTAQIVARKIGVDYATGKLDDPDYNMTLGSSFLGQLVDRFSGSYVMAIAGYNAGPGRPLQWSAYCGDPRGGSTDPIDFIECIPFSETRNYVMRVMENMVVYRARENGGSAPITLSGDLRRGAYGYAGGIPPVASAAP